MAMYLETLLSWIVQMLVLLLNKPDILSGTRSKKRITRRDKSQIARQLSEANIIVQMYLLQ
jgi:hypothetical protein